MRSTSIVVGRQFGSVGSSEWRRLRPLIKKKEVASRAVKFSLDFWGGDGAGAVDGEQLTSTESIFDST